MKKFETKLRYTNRFMNNERRFMKLEAQPNFARLAKIYKEETKRLVIFCGAGSSREAGLPNWDELVDQLLESYLSLAANTAVSEKLADEISNTVKYIPDNWSKISYLKNQMGAQFEIEARRILTPKSINCPTFFEHVWHLNPHALLSFNLDGFAANSYAKRKTGIVPNHLLGVDAPLSRLALGDSRPLIVDLHGQIDNPRSWILAREERDTLLAQHGYAEFLKSMFSHNLVIFYGVGLKDLTVSGQLGYLHQTGFVTGDYFLIKRKPDDEDMELAKNLPVSIVYTGDDKTWEAGFIHLVSELNKGSSADSIAYPVVSSVNISGSIPSPIEILKLDPDQIRSHLASTTKNFYKNDAFDYESYSEFCKRYDTAIHISTRVNPNDAEQKWLGNRISSELGKGNFGKVYQAFTPDEKSIAIKVAHMEVRDDPAMLNSFRRGVQSMRILSDSGIRGVVRLLDASELPPSITMEYIEGIDLQKYINEYSHSNLRSKLEICLWICDILFECHSHEKIILHRDLRPSNIMISGPYWERVEKDNIIILDFDLSWFKGADGAEFYMNASQALGFLAPEQLNMKSNFSNRSALVDVYGVGMLLYFIVSGETPLANASTRIDWEQRVSQSSSQLFTKDWKSSKYLFSQLVLAATNENQKIRPQLPDFKERLETLIDVFGEKYPFDCDSCIIEFLCRLAAGGASIDYDAAARRGTHITGAGTRVDLITNGSTITCSISHTVGESANRHNRPKALTEALFKAKSKIETFAKVDEKFTSVVKGGSHLKFIITPPSDIRKFNTMFSGIDFAVVEISKD
ncbi:protein kinase domain-containing protein [Pararhizobium sp. O133]|uniref:protein kinase domain-containing protein n=1 Tax=Pararhizobium sp. O133 TaxID=3449278 RepID=UPI003F68291A